MSNANLTGPNRICTVSDDCVFVLTAWKLKKKKKNKNKNANMLHLALLSIINHII